MQGKSEIFCLEEPWRKKKEKEKKQKNNKKESPTQTTTMQVVVRCGYAQVIGRVREARCR